MKLIDCTPGRQVDVACGHGKTTLTAKIVSLRGTQATVITEDGTAYKVHHCRLRKVEGKE